MFFSKKNQVKIYPEAHTTYQYNDFGLPKYKVLTKWIKDKCIYKEITDYRYNEKGFCISEITKIQDVGE